MTPKEGLDIVGAIQILANVTKEEWGQVAMRYCSGDPIRIAFLKAAVAYNNEFTAASPEHRERMLAIGDRNMISAPAGTFKTAIKVSANEDNAEEVDREDGSIH